jgi:hypothetical protein
MVMYTKATGSAALTAAAALFPTQSVQAAMAAAQPHSIISMKRLTRSRMLAGAEVGGTAVTGAEVGGTGTGFTGAEGGGTGEAGAYTP